MPKKIPRRLVALSASAVATIYFAGLLSSAATADNGSAAVSESSVAPTDLPTVVVGATATPTPTSARTGYADGTFSGTGSGRFGSVTVSVTTSAGSITNVQITKVSTTFPVSQIASLPAQVVQTQSASVNAVSGATASSQAFKQAIQQALAQALAANSSSSSAQG